MNDAQSNSPCRKGPMNEDRFWPRGDADAREWILDIRDWRKRCRETYKRREDEYLPPGNSLLLVSHDEARNTVIHEGGSFEGLSHIWAAVRGTDYEPAQNWCLPMGESHAIIVELVPTPDKPFDPCAIAVEYEGKKLGNLGRRYARHAHWTLRQLNYRGYRAMTAAIYRAFERTEIHQATPEAFVALPTFAAFDKKLPPVRVQVAQFRRLWDALDEKLRDEVRSDDYHLTEETTRKILNYSEQFPELTLPTQAEPSAIPHNFNLALRDIRHEDVEVRRLAREKEVQEKWVKDSNAIAELAVKGLTRQEITDCLQIPRSRVNRIIKELGIGSMVTVNQPSRITEEQKDEVLRRAATGQSNTQIEREMHLDKGRVSKILAERGVAREQLIRGVSEYHIRAMLRRLELGKRAVSLQNTGLTRKQIAEELGVSESSVKTRISDARFFANPFSNRSRLEDAISARRRQLTSTQARSTAERRGISGRKHEVYLTETCLICSVVTGSPPLDELQ